MTRSLTTTLKSLARIDNPNMPALIGDKLNVTFLLDKSGSMAELKAQTIRAFNDYLGELRSNKSIICSLYQFPGGWSDEIVTVYESQPAATAFELSDDNFHPSGGTPLFRSIVEVLNKLWNTKRHERHVVVILTDGQDTGGGAEFAKSLIQSRRADGWQILFLGADINIDSMARQLGIDKLQSLSYNAKNFSSETFKALAKSISEYADKEPHEEIDVSSLPQLPRSK